MHKKDNNKLKEGEDDPTYSDEQRQLYKDLYNDLNTETQARLKILSQKKRSSDVGRKYKTGH